MELLAEPTRLTLASASYVAKLRIQDKLINDELLDSPPAIEVNVEILVLYPLRDFKVRTPGFCVRLLSSSSPGP